MGGGGGGGEGIVGFLSSFSMEWGKLYYKLIFSCRLNHWACVHEKNFQIEATALELKLDKGKVLGVATLPSPPPPPPIDQKLAYFSNHEDDIQS